MNSFITYIHDEPASLKSKLIQMLLPLTGMKRVIERSLRNKSFISRPYPVPNSLKKKFDLNSYEKQGRRVWTIKPRVNGTEKTILYIHGGAYILNISKLYWQFVEELISITNATVVVPDYPLAPGAGADQAFSFVNETYNSLLELNSPANIVIIGDSAGGGLALGFVQKLRNEKRPQPALIILLSPWLDISMSNPDLFEVEKKDMILNIRGLKMAGEAYAGEIDPEDYRVSPIYGSLEGLGKISVFTGTNDILIADARKLKSIMNEADIPFSYFEYPDMFHDWVIVPRMKESRHALGQIECLING